MAAWASWSVVISTNPNPFDRPVSRSVMSWARWTLPSGAGGLTRHGGIIPRRGPGANANPGFGAGKTLTRAAAEGVDDIPAGSDPGRDVSAGSAGPGGCRTNGPDATTALPPFPGFLP